MSPALDELKSILARAQQEISKVVIGQTLPIDLALIAIFTNQHALVEGVPGVAKTLLVKALAHILGTPFKRIQFTPDLMPSDIIGTNAFNLQKNDFSFVPGPVFTTFLIADEINRAPSKTQSALLQAMQERQVTVDRTTYDLSPNFTVFATQNPIEYEGTYALPEAQKDRFMLKIRMDVPDRAEELTLAERMLGEDARASAEPGHPGESRYRIGTSPASWFAQTSVREARAAELSSGHNPGDTQKRVRACRCRTSRNAGVTSRRQSARGFERARLRHAGRPASFSQASTRTSSRIAPGI